MGPAAYNPSCLNIWTILEGDETAVSMRPGSSSEEIARVLVEQAKALWGPERAEAIRALLEQTARQLADVDRSLPDREVEPGFYQ